VTHPALVPPLAIERYRVLEPHLADGIPLADLARTGTLSERTLQRWLGRYRAEGLAGLARLPRNDRGRLHLPEHLVETVSFPGGSQNTALIEENFSAHFAVGEEIEHEDFGRGKILEIDGDDLKIDFGSFGEKWLSLTYARIKKL
jgi:transcriptional regulator GlxA family with amidase domain